MVWDLMRFPDQGHGKPKTSRRDISSWTPELRYVPDGGEHSLSVCAVGVWAIENDFGNKDG